MKKLVLVAAPPACGKNYVSELICRSCGQISYFDKDDLSVLLHRSFDLCGEKLNMDGDFYLQNLRSAEYATLFDLAFSALRFSDKVLVNAPLIKEVGDPKFMRGLKERAETLGAELILVWVVVSDRVRYERMKARNLARDSMKLAHWDEYVGKTAREIPFDLATKGVVDHLFVFENENSETADESLQKLLVLLE